MRPVSSNTDVEWPDPRPTTIGDLDRGDWLAVLFVWIVVSFLLAVAALLPVAMIANAQTGAEFRATVSEIPLSVVMAPVQFGALLVAYTLVTGSLPRTDDGIAWGYLGLAAVIVSIPAVDALASVPVVWAVAIGATGVAVAWWAIDRINQHNSDPDAN